MRKSSATPHAGETPATPPNVHRWFKEFPTKTAPRPYPMTKIENGYPWTLEPRTVRKQTLCKPALRSGPAVPAFT